MVSFEDARKQVELLFGQIQGYSYVAWTSIPGIDGGNLLLGENYIFVGTCFVSATNALNAVAIKTWNDYEITCVAHAPANQSAFSHVSFIGKDKSNAPMIDVGRCDTPNFVSVIGWKFQVNK